MKVSPEMEAQINLLLAEDAAKKRKTATLSPSFPSPQLSPVKPITNVATTTKKAKLPRIAIRDGWECSEKLQPHVLAFDGASQTVGYAVLTADMKLVAFGVLKGGSGDEESRASRLIDAALSVARDYPSNIVACEITKGIRYGLRSRSTDLATLARVQGRIVQCLEDTGRRVIQVLDVSWTGRLPKPKRAERLRVGFPEYAKWVADKHDAGLDAADAIGLALHCIERNCINAIVGGIQ